MGNEKEGWHYGFMSDVGQAAAQRSVCGHATEQLVADASIDKSRVSPGMSPRKSGMPGWHNFDVQASQNVESQFQMYQRGELRGQGTVWSRQKHIVLDFDHMLQHVEGSETKKRKIRRVET